MRNNTQTNAFIKRCIVFGDFVVLNIILFLFLYTQDALVHGSDVAKRVFILTCNVALVLSETQFSTVVHERWAGADRVLRRTLMLVTTQTLLAYVFLRAVRFGSKVGLLLLFIGVTTLIVFFLVRIMERWLLKKFRHKGLNTRTVTLVGSHDQLLKLYKRLSGDLTMGYKIYNFYTRL